VRLFNTWFVPGRQSEVVLDRRPVLPFAPIPASPSSLSSGLGGCMIPVAASLVLLGLIGLFKLMNR
jgi:hypothetical protein